MLKNIKFQTRIFLSFLLLLIVIIIFFGIFFNIYIFKIFKNDINENIFQLSTKVSQQIDTYIKANNKALVKMITNKNLLITMKEINANHKNMRNTELVAYDRLLGDIIFDVTNLSISPSNIFIFSKDMGYVYSYGIKSNSITFDKIINEDYRKKLAADKIITYPNISGSRKDSFSIVREISDIFDNVYGYIEIQQSYTALDSICNIGDLGNVIIIDNDGNIIYPGDSIEEDSINEQEAKLYPGMGMAGKNGVFKDKSNNYCLYYKSDYLGWTIYIKYYKEPMLQSLYAMQTATITVIAIIVLLSILFLYFASRGLVLPIRKLRNSIVNVSPQNMSLNLHEKFYNNEINLLNDGFQNMLDRLKSSMEAEIKANKAESNSRFLALQAQIAPHFIHNALYIMSISAQENKPDIVMEMCRQLSDMLRYIISSSSSGVTIEEEVRHTSNYLALLKRKYEDFLDYSIEVRDEVKNISVPRLTIQPFAENCIQHGLKDTSPPWKISIVCSLEGGSWCIEIKDNGSGFKEDKLAEITRQLKSCADIPQIQPKTETGTGMGNMGIVNTVIRLKLMYGDSLEFSISNSSEGGTVIRIKGPYTPV